MPCVPDRARSRTFKHWSPAGVLISLLLALAACDAGSGAPAVTATPPPATPTLAVLLTTAAPAAAPATVAPTAPPTLGPGMFANPLINQDFPDPDSLQVDDTYYAYATNTGSINIPAAKSTDLVHWQLLPDALPVLPLWAEGGNTWAPEVTTTADGPGYVMYFTARVKGTGTQCIGVATSPRPEGPFRSATEEPLICQRDRGGSIDPSTFTDEDGTRYVLWKNDGNCCGSNTWLYIQQVSADGLTLAGEPAQLIRQDLIWEGNVIEAPTLWKHNGKYYLFYSANAYQTLKYAVGYARADHILGPYEKGGDPILASVLAPPATLGPGGQDVVVDKDGDTWLLYHAWDPTVTFRTLNIDELVWEGDTPVVQGPDRLPQAVP
jgi:beta-xylosidase